MFEKYKVFVRGSTETKKVLGEIVTKLNVHVTEYELSDDPRYQFGKCPSNDDNFNIWYAAPCCSSYFVSYGYKEVTPQQFREIWLGEESSKKGNEFEAFCCKGCEKLREVCQRLAKEGFINPSEYNDFERVKDTGYYHFICNKTVVHKTNGNYYGEIVSPEEFYERIAGKPWERKKKILIGFIGNSDVHIEHLPIRIKNPKHLKGTARGCIFYVENNELTYCLIGKEPRDITFVIVSYSQFLIRLLLDSQSLLKSSEEVKVERLPRSEECFELKQETKETNLVQSFVKNPSENFLSLSKQKSLKIIL